MRIGHFLRHRSGLADRAETRIPTEAGMNEQQKELEKLLVELLKPSAGAVWLAIAKMCEPAVFVRLQEFFKSIEPPDSASGK